MRQPGTQIASVGTPPTVAVVHTKPMAEQSKSLEQRWKQVVTRLGSPKSS
jgi:hypothetical protein